MTDIMHMLTFVALVVCGNVISQIIFDIAKSDKDDE